jgi:hypothetical protein
MNTFIYIISFILHAISFFIIILLYYRLEQTRDIERKQATMLKDMEEVLSAYIIEMKEENERFLDKVRQEDQPEKQKQIDPNGVTPHRRGSGSQSSIDTVEPDLTEQDLSSLLPSYDDLGVTKKMREQTDLPKDVSIKEEENHLQLLPIGQQAKLLHNKGLTVEEIAKKLKKGKTEIELFLKFNV